MLDRLFDWIVSRTSLRGVAELGDRWPAPASRRTHRARPEAASTPAIGDMTIEQHARALVRSHAESGDAPNQPWISDIMGDAVKASERAHNLFFR